MMGLLGAGCPVETFENSENARRKALGAFRGLEGHDRARSLGSKDVSKRRMRGCKSPEFLTISSKLRFDRKSRHIILNSLI